MTSIRIITGTTKSNCLVISITAASISAATQPAFPPLPNALLCLEIQHISITITFTRITSEIKTLHYNIALYIISLHCITVHCIIVSHIVIVLHHNRALYIISLHCITVHYIIVSHGPLLHHYIHSPNHHQTIRSSRFVQCFNITFNIYNYSQCHNIFNY